MSATRRFRHRLKVLWEQVDKRVRRKIAAGRVDLTVIPPGIYCYSGRGKDAHVCPFWEARPDKPAQAYGYCSLMEIGDWETIGGLLWDQVKECGLNRADEVRP